MKKNVHIGLISLYVFENSGVRRIAASLRKHGFKVTEIYFKDWVNNRISAPSEKELSNLIKILKEREVDLVGISVRASAFIDIAKFVTSRIRDELRLPIIWGGIHPTSMPEDCIKTADALCVGEAEFAMADFAKKFSENNQNLPVDVLNFWVRHNGEIIRNPSRPLVDNLDILPFKDFHSHQDKFYIDNKIIRQGDPCVKEPIYLVMASRGCVYSKCSFCINTMLNKIYPGRGYYYRRRSVENVIEELIYVKKQFKNIKRVRFDDEIFPLNDRWIDEFCKQYNRINLPFECHLHPFFVKEKKLERLKAVGLDTVCIGIQNVERINKILYERVGSNQDILKAADILHRLKFKICYQVILDDPISTENDKRELFKLLLSLPRPFELYLFSLTVYPKTALAEKLLKDKLISEDGIEGQNKKAFRQFRVDLAYPRSKHDIFWLSLIVLVSKNFIPRLMLKKISNSKFLMRHSNLLALFAQVCNLIKMSKVAFIMLLKGELSFALLRRWLNLKSMITQ